MRLSNPAKGTLVAMGAALSVAAISGQGCKTVDTSTPETNEVVSRAATTKYDWMQFGGDSRHGGNNTLETQISSSNVSGLTKLFQVGLKETVEGAPVVLTNVTTPSGTHDIVFVTSRNGYITAMDAYTGAVIWLKQLGTMNITMSSPAIDPSRAFVYTVGLDGYIHKLAVGDGTETTTGGWPELATLKIGVEKDGTALSIATFGGVSYLYLGAGGYDGDGGEYQGHVTVVNLNTGAQKVFNAMCSNNTAHLGTGGCAGQKSGIWAKAGVTIDPATNRLYIGTGNGTYSPSTFMWGDSILALNVDGTGAGNGNPLDSYTPSNFQSLQNSDKDLGSTNLLILANNGSKYPHLGMQSGKDAELRLINLDNMSGQGAPGKVAGEISSTPLATGGEVQNPCATWINPADNSTWVFVVSPSNGINASKLQIDGSGNPSLVNVWHAGGGGGGAAVANNVLYYASNGNLHALNPTTGAQLWNSTAIGAIHWQTPAIVNGVLYVGDNGRELTAYSLPGGGGTGNAGTTGGGAGTTGTGAAGTSGGAETALMRTGWTATASSSAGADVPANALDGNTGSRWSTGQTMANGMYYLLDTQSSHTFDRLTMDSAGSGNDYARGYQIFVSNDGTTFGNAITSGTGTAALITVSFAAQTARYVKIVQTGTSTSWWSIAEINLYTAGSGGGTGAAGTSGGTGTAGTSGSAGNGVKINAGGPAAAPFVADVDFTGGTTINHANTIDLSGVTNPAPAAVYQTGHLGNFSYTIPGFRAGSSHTVRLHMCETYHTGVGQRVFNVSINGTQVLTAYDIFQAAGAKNKAIAPQFTATATAGGTFVIQFTTVTDNSLVSGIEIQ